MCVLVCVLRRSVMLYYTPPPLRLGMKMGVASHADKGKRKKEKNNKGVWGGETEKIDLLNCGEISQWVGRGLRDPARKKATIETRHSSSPTSVVRLSYIIYICSSAL